MHLKFREKRMSICISQCAKAKMTGRCKKRSENGWKILYLRERHVCRRNSKNPSSQWQTPSTQALFATFKVHCSFNTQSLPSSWAINEKKKKNQILQRILFVSNWEILDWICILANVTQLNTFAYRMRARDFLLQLYAKPHMQKTVFNPPVHTACIES